MLQQFGHPARGTVVAITLGLLLAPAAVATPLQCRLALLTELGWQLDPGGHLSIDGGQPCDRADLGEAQAAGDLRAELPSDPLRRDAALDALLAHPATRCAFAFRYGQATRRAVDRLAGNRGFRFSTLQPGWIHFGGGARRAGWTPIRRFGRGFVPAAGNRRAIATFYDGRVRAECGVGRQIAQYAAQAELYGDDFDHAFAADEIVIGTFLQLHGTRSVLLGSGAGDLERDGAARAAAARGRQGFAGLPGFIVHAGPRDLLDDTSNQAQNFVVYDVSAEAAAALRANGGFEPYNARNRVLWQLSRQLDLPGLRGFQRLFTERAARAHARLSARERTVVARMQALLDDPFYSGFTVYVHPHGVRTVGWHLVRLLDRNPRTPYRIELALHNVHGPLFERWLHRRLEGCEAAAGQSAAMPGRTAAAPVAEQPQPGR